MESWEFAEMSIEELKQYIQRHRESDYLLIDVRQPMEYQLRHIPGAMFIPLMEFEARLFTMPPDKDLIFYCHNGGRSMAAASLTVEAEVTTKSVYQLTGGIMAWDGQVLSGFPKVRIFDTAQSTAQLLQVAMDLEKGAWRFYNLALTQLAGHALAPILQRLSKAENAHARTIYRFWQEQLNQPQPFESLFEALEGNILEGGQSFDSVADQLNALQTSANTTPCLELIELALSIEYAAYDLYRTMGDRSPDSAAREAFISLAQAEKAHMRTLMNAIGVCTPDDPQ